MLTIGDRFPEFELKAVSGADPKTAIKQVNNKTYGNKWLVVIAWPKDFTFVCPTEIVGYGELAREFNDRDAQLLGLSTDTDFVHAAWRKHHPDLTHSPYPWLADPNKKLCAALGILERNEGIAYRATFIVDPDGIIRHVTVNDLSVGRNPQETLRILDALQTDELCPCNWQKGEEVLAA